MRNLTRCRPVLAVRRWSANCRLFSYLSWVLIAAFGERMVAEQFYASIHSKEVQDGGLQQVLTLVFKLYVVTYVILWFLPLWLPLALFVFSCSFRPTLRAIERDLTFFLVNNILSLANGRVLARHMSRYSI